MSFTERCRKYIAIVHQRSLLARASRISEPGFLYEESELIYAMLLL